MDINEITSKIVTEAMESVDEFIFTTIKPWCEEKIQREISKRDLERALIQYFSKEQKPCEDAISRQAAINSIWDGTNMDIYTREVKEELEALPPVTPQPKTGHWIMKNPSPYEPWRCSNCNSVGSNLYNFCPNCGAKMKADSEVR